MEIAVNYSLPYAEIGAKHTDKPKLAQEVLLDDHTQEVELFLELVSAIKQVDSDPKQDPKSKNKPVRTEPYPNDTYHELLTVDMTDEQRSELMVNLVMEKLTDKIPCVISTSDSLSSPGDSITQNQLDDGNYFTDWELRTGISANEEFKAYTYRGDILLFHVDHSLKALLMEHMFKNVTSARHGMTIVSKMMLLDKIEHKVGKPVYMFNETEMDDLIREAEVGLSAHSRMIVKIILTLCECINSPLYYKWKEMTRNERVESLIKERMEEDNDSFYDVITMDMIKAYARFEIQPSVAVLPYLIYHGISTAQNLKEDDLRNLKESDMESNGVWIGHEATKPGEESTRRFVELDSYGMQLLRAGFNDKVFYGGRGDKEFLESPYLLKAVRQSKKSTQQISYYSFTNRLRRFQDFVKSEYGVEDASAKYIEMCGQMAFIKDQLDKGVELFEAVKNCMKHYGQLPQDEDADTYHKLSLTHQVRWTRLRRKWRLFPKE